MSETTDYTADDLMALGLGDLVELPSPLTPLTDEPVCLLLESKSLISGTVTFRMSMYGVFLGKAVLSKTKSGDPKWQFS